MLSCNVLSPRSCGNPMMHQQSYDSDSSKPPTHQIMQRLATYFLACYLQGWVINRLAKQVCYVVMEIQRCACSAMLKILHQFSMPSHSLENFEYVNLICEFFGDVYLQSNQLYATVLVLNPLSILTRSIPATPIFEMQCCWYMGIRMIMVPEHRCDTPIVAVCLF